MSLSTASFDILLSLRQGPSHGYAMMKMIQEHRGGKPIQAGLLYTTLSKLISAQLIEETTGDDDNTDPRRRYYRLTAKGERAFLEDAADALRKAEKIKAMIHAGAL